MKNQNLHIIKFAKNQIPLFLEVSLEGLSILWNISSMNNEYFRPYDEVLDLCYEGCKNKEEIYCKLELCQILWN